MAGRRIGEAFVAVKADTSGTGAEVERELGKEFDGVGKKSGKKFGKSFGDEVLKAVTGSTGLNAALKALKLDEIDIKASPKDALAAIAETEAKLKALSGDATTVEVKLKTERALSDLARFKKHLGHVGDDEGPPAARGFVSKFADSLSGIPLPASIAGWGAAIGLALAPFLGAAVSGAVIGGAGVGGVIGGVLLASRDARVKSAGQQLGQRLLGSLEQDASPFIDPLLHGLDTLEAAFGRSEGHLRSIFANDSRYVQPLIDGLTGFLEPVIGGFDDLIAHAGPVIEAIRQGLHLVGEAVGDVFHSLSDNGVEAAAAIYAVFQIIAGSIRTVGLMINGLTELFGWIIKAELALGVISDDGKKAIADFQAAADAASGSGADLATTFQAAAPAASALNAAVAPIGPNLQDIAAATRAIHTANADLFASETAVATAVANASAKIKENGRTLSTNSAKGRENRDALSQVASALQAQYDKYVAVNGVGPKSAALADTLRGKFIKLARSAGESASGAKNLADKILDIPSSHDTKITARNAAALEAAREVRRAISSLPSSKVIDVAIRVTGTSAARSAVAAALGKQSLPARAGGGPVVAGQAYVVGERQPEVFVPNMDGMILPRLPAVTGPADGSAAMLARLDRLIAAVERVAPGVGAHLSRAVRGVDASIGSSADLYARAAW